MNNPKQCPFCTQRHPQRVTPSSSEWCCRLCHTSFVCTRLPSDEGPPDPPAPPKKVERTDLIAQAYEGELTVAAALELAISLTQQAAATVMCGGFTNRSVPTNGPGTIGRALPKLRITA